MPRHFVICSDGTRREPRRKHVTNVVKTVRAVKRRDQDGICQVVFYDRGLRTGNPRDRLAGIRALKARDRLHNLYRGIDLPFRTRDRRIGVSNRDENLHPSALERYQRRPRYKAANLVRHLRRTGQP